MVRGMHARYALPMPTEKSARRGRRALPIPYSCFQLSQPMSRPTSILLAIVLAVSSTEGLAYWWMHPATPRGGQPVLCYKPTSSRSADVPPSSSARDPQSSSATDNRQATADDSPAPIFTPLPAIYDKSAPLLRCSGGQVFQVALGDTISLYLAFFEWNQTDTGSVFEAYIHLPESCLGSLGMILLSKEPPIAYRVGGQTLMFDHTVFRDPPQGGGAGLALPVHSYRAVWISGITESHAGAELADDKLDHPRAIRLQSALSRYRPAYARVIQGTVRGAPTADLAWQAFANTMLTDLTFETR